MNQTGLPIRTTASFGRLRRPGDDPGKVGHPHPGEWPLACGQRTRSGMAEALDLEHRDGGERHGLRMGGPLVGRAQRVAGQPPCRQRVFQLEGVGPGKRARNRIVVVRAAITVDRHGRKRAGRARCQASGAQLSRHDMVPKSRPLAKPRKPCIHMRRGRTRLGKILSPMRRRPDRDGATSRQCRPRPPRRGSRGGRKRCHSLYALVAPETRRESSFASVRSSSAILPESLPKSPPDAEVRLIEAPGLGPALFPARRWPSRTIFLLRKSSVILPGPFHVTVRAELGARSVWETACGFPLCTLYSSMK